MEVDGFYCKQCHKKVRALIRPHDWIVALISSGPIPSDMFCSWTCLAQYSTMVAGLAEINARQEAQKPTESDASTPEGRQGPDVDPDASAAPQLPQRELPRPDAISLGRVRLHHAAGHTDLAIHELLDVIENLQAQIESVRFAKDES